MNKFLRYSLSLVLAFVASVTFAQEVTFDFDKDYKTLFPELTGTSSSTSHDGDITKTMTCTTNGISVAVSAKTPGSPTDNRIWSSSPRLRMYSGTLTIQAPADKKIASIDIIINGKWNDKNNADVGTNNKGSWTGDANKVVYTIAGNTQIKSIKVMLAGTKIEYTDAASVKELLANNQEAKDYINLKLTNAKVLYVNSYNGTVNTYVREGDTAIEMRTLGIDMPVNSIISGTVKVNLAYDAGIPYLSASKETNGENLKITESNEAAEPVIATVKDILDGKYTNDLIKIKEFTFSKEEYTTGKFNYYANDGENKIMIFDKFSGIGGVSKLTEGEKYTLTGIFGVIFKNIPEVLPIKAVEKFEPTSITNITTDEAAKNAPVYNLAGQKVTKAYKGVVIKNGKKMIQK
ncbi:hypothetical protein FYJ72_04565 [Prevotella copri]|uniref:Lipocalin-like domain-containing protein n=1 Tax=Segatella copri TaxID=165179 RepID=A0A6I2TXJ1_9BACT|nr:hypothetical protein [Segatella copri]MST76968.1 hypothetical protein [Segatella copri]